MSGYFVYRKKRRDGLEKHYTAKLKPHGAAKWQPWPTGCTEKKSAEAAAKKEKERRDRVALGLELEPPPQSAPVATVDLTAHLAAFEQFQGSAHDPTQADIMCGLIFAFCRETKIKTLTQLTAPAFEKWRDDCGVSLPKRSNKTKNNWLSALRVFIDFLRRRGLADRNPLADVESLSTRGKETFSRRPLTEEEFSRLMAVAGPRRVLYMMGLLTGLRRGALYALTWGQVHLNSLDDLGPRVIIPSKDMKNRHADIKVIPEILADLLLEYRPKDANPSDPVFAHRILPDRTAMLPEDGLEFWKNDLKKAGILFETPEGRLDFHGVRHSTGTWGAMSREGPAALQALMSHKTAAMTARYTHIQHLPQKQVAQSIADRIASATEKRGAHGRAQDGVPEGPLAVTIHAPKNAGAGSPWRSA